MELKLDAIALRVEIDELGLFRAKFDDDSQPDVTITAPLSAITTLALDGKATGMGAVRIVGNAELADTVSFVLRHLEWDAEADLATVVGDIAAHRIMNGLRRLAPLPKRAAASFAGNVRDYLVEEQPVLLSRAAIGQLDLDVHTLRDDIARLEKRLARILVTPGSRRVS